MIEKFINNKACDNKSEDAVPVDPLASRKLGAVGGRLIEVFTILGLRLIPNIDGGGVNPAPAATPVELILILFCSMIIIYRNNTNNTITILL